MSLELTTSVRFRRSRLWALAAVVPVVALLALGVKLGIFLFLFPAPLFLLRMNRIVEARVVASEEGLRIGERLIPRAAFTSGLVRHEDGRVFVALDGREHVDVAVTSNVAADALLSALRLDAASAVAEVRLVRGMRKAFNALGIIVLVWTLLMFRALQPTMFGVLTTGIMIALGVLGLRKAREVKLGIGADGISIRELGSQRFIPHDAIEGVETDGDAVVLRPKNGEPLRWELPTRRNRENESTTALERRRDEANAIVRRIRQARAAFRERANAPELAVALDRGAHTTREWLADLRKLGEGTIATFRTIGVAREQLLDVVESTTASAKDRMAALVALRPHLREEEKTRIRVATESIAAPEVRDRMVRVLDTEEEHEMIEALEAVDRR